MKLTVSKLLPFLFVIYSFGAISESYIDHSYGYLEPQVIYDQTNYFQRARLQELKSTKGLPTKGEIAQLRLNLEKIKSLGRMEGFGQRSLPEILKTCAYPALAAVVYVVSFGRLSIWSPFVVGMSLDRFFHTIMGDQAAADTVKHYLEEQLGISAGRRAKDALTDLEVSYIAHKHLIPAELQEHVEEMLFSTRLGGTLLTTTKSYVKTLIDLRKSQTRSCVIKKNWLEIERDISKALSRYPEELRQEILDLSYTYYVNGTSDNSSLARLVAFFLGAPGLGKSRAAKLVAKAFGVPAVTVSLAGRSPKDLWGSENTPGILITNLAALGCDSGFMIFEDIDSAIAGGSSQAQSLETSLLELFDTTQDSIRSSFLQAEARTSKIFMIGTGNTAFAKQALADRVSLVEFTDFPKEVKEEIILEEYLKTRLKDHRVDVSEFAPAMEALKQKIKDDKSVGLRSDQKIVNGALAKFGREREKAKNATKH